jgi:GntR family transcriptional regulator
MATNQDSLPKYYRICQDIIEAIREGELREGDRVPSENELIENYQVSNTTARKALAELEQSGWANRVKGRGTFVTSRAVERDVDKILSFTRNMRQAGRTPETRLLNVRLERSPHVLTIHGRTYTMPGPMTAIERMRLADGVPMMKETRYISREFCPGIGDKDLTGSLYDIYEQEYGVQLVEIQQMLSAVMLEEEELDWFGLEEVVPAFCVEGVTFCGKELILEMERSIYRGDMYRFLVTARS